MYSTMQVLLLLRQVCGMESDFVESDMLRHSWDAHCHSPEEVLQKFCAENNFAPPEEEVSSEEDGRY